MRQPHIHHDGPITVELCDSLEADLSQMEREIPVDCPDPPDDGGWHACRRRWLDTLEYARLRLQEVTDAVRQGEPTSPEYHGKIVDICLSIKDEFAYGKGRNFTAGR